MKLDSLQTLYVEELRDLYDAENQLLKALPQMAHSASAPELKQAFEDHFEDTKGHLERLEEIFDKLSTKPAGKTCQGMKGLIAESSEILSQAGDKSVLDAGIIAVGQKVEHYEIASYGTLHAFARMLGEEDAAELLQETLEEERYTDQRLTELAEEIVNVAAPIGD